MKVFLTLILFFFLAQSTFANSQMEIFSDQNFAKSTTNFSPGQTVYVKIESDDPGKKEKVLKLKDNNYADISTFSLTQEGTGPFRYKVSFVAPSNPGIYSAEATISSTGSANKLVKTIQVDQVSSVDNRINIRTQVQGTKTQTTPTSTSEGNTSQFPTGTSTATISSEEPLSPTPKATTFNLESSNTWQKIIQFFQNLFKFIFRF